MQVPPAAEQLGRAHGMVRFAARSSASVALAVGSLMGFVLILAVRLRSVVGPLGVDLWIGRHLTGRLARTGFLTVHEYGWIARVGAPSFVGVTTLLVSAWAIRRRDAAGVLFAMLAPGLAFVLAELVIKPAVGRKIHAGDPLSIFPSGTVAVVTACAAATCVLVRRWLGRAYAALTGVLLSGVALVVCVAVVELGWHYATDVIGALALAGAVVLAAAELAARLERLRARRLSPAAETR